MKGWISIYRDIQDHWTWQDPKYFKWWVTILLNVNHEAKQFPIGTKMFVCNPGQSFRSIEQWTDMFSCSKKTTIKFFKMLEDDQMISTETIGSGNRRKHLLTVVNWDKYQKKETEVYTERVPEITPKEYPNVTPNNKEEQFNNENNRSYPLQDMSEKDFSAPDAMALDQSSFKASSEKENIVSGASVPTEEEKPAKGKKKGKEVDFDIIVAMYHTECPSFPRIMKLSEARKTKIRIRFEEMKGELSIIKKVFQKLEESKFCRGDNKNGWKASFDWIFENEKNWVKVYEGNYDNKTRNNVPGRNESVNDIWK